MKPSGRNYTRLRGCTKTPSPLAGEGWGGGLFFNGLARQRLYKNASQSRPFDHPETGKIAVKVINHYGDEVLKVFGV
jgi:hypothetical protein